MTTNETMATIPSTTNIVDPSKPKGRPGIIGAGFTVIVGVELASAPSLSVTVKDYFVFQVYKNGDNYILSEWGISAEGTYAGGVCFIDIIYPNIQDYTDQYYIYSWTDLNDDDMPQPDEIALETSGN